MRVPGVPLPETSSQPTKMRDEPESSNRDSTATRIHSGRLELRDLEKDPRKLRDLVKDPQKLRDLVEGNVLCLRDLRIGDARLVALAPELGTLTGLTLLDLAGNNLGRPGMVALAAVLPNFASLTHLDLERNHLEAGGVVVMESKLRKLKELTFLNLQGNKIGDSGAFALTREVRELRRSHTLDVGNNGIRTRGAQFLMDTRKTNQCTILRLTNNPIGIEGPTAIDHFPYLTSLDLQNTGLSKLPMLQSPGSNLTSLNLARNAIGPDKGLVRILGVLTQVKTLNLMGTSIGATEATRLALSLGKLRELTDLNLGDNQIGADGAKALAGVPEMLRRLTRLVLRNNQIGDAGAKSLMDLDRPTPTALGLLLNRPTPTALGSPLVELKHLDLEGNQIRFSSTLATALGLLTNLEHLNVGANRIGVVTHAEHLARELGKLTKLTFLSFRGVLPGRHWGLAAAMLGNLTQLEHLDISDNGWYNDTALSLQLGSLINLTSLSLAESGIRNVGWTALRLEHLTKLTSLSRLSLAGNLLTSPPELDGISDKLNMLDLRGNRDMLTEPSPGQREQLTIRLEGCSRMLPPSSTLDDAESSEDYLDIQGLCQAVAGFIVDRNTRPPFAFAFHGVWGKGKSSAMKLVQSELERGGAGSSIINVRFNAWLYSSPAEVWAGLAVSVGRGIEGSLGFMRRYGAYLAYGFKTRKRELMVSFVVPALLSLIATLVVVFLIPQLLGAVVTKKTLGGFYNSLRSLGAVGWLAFVAWRFALFFKPVSRRMAEYLVSPVSTHADKVGYQNAVISDLEFLGRRMPLHPSEGAKKVVVYIDDLDRCRDKAVVSVLEAVNLVLGGCNTRDVQIFTVFGLDMRMTVAAIARETDLVLGEEAEEREQEARRFLQKIVQTSIELPTTSEAGRMRYVEHILGPPSIAIPLGEDYDARDEQTQFNPYRAETGESDLAAAGLSKTWPKRRLAALWSALKHGGEGFVLKLRSVLGRRSTETAIASNVVIDSIASSGFAWYAALLPDNPRQIKAMINNYRLSYRVLRERAEGISANLRYQLVTWAILVGFCPALSPFIGKLCEKRAGSDPQADVLDVLLEDVTTEKTRLEHHAKAMKAGTGGTADPAVTKDLLAMQLKADKKVASLQRVVDKLQAFCNTTKAYFEATGAVEHLSYSDLKRFRMFSGGLSLAA